MGTTANIDPVEGWKIVDGKLYLNYSREIQKNKIHVQNELLDYLQTKLWISEG
jgi:hypothetical protein